MTKFSCFVKLNRKSMVPPCATNMAVGERRKRVIDSLNTALGEWKKLMAIMSGRGYYANLFYSPIVCLILPASADAKENKRVLYYEKPYL